MQGTREEQTHTVHRLFSLRDTLIQVGEGT
jgi:hypothetical protein